MPSMFDLLLDMIREAHADDEQVSRAVDTAVTQYSANRPRAVVKDVVLASAQVLPALDGWVTGQSEVQSIEVPVGRIPPAFLEPEDFLKRVTPSGEEICLIDARTVGDTLRVAYTTLHTVDTIPAKDYEAVACWAAAFIADQVATQYSNNSQPTIQADSVDSSNPAREWAARAKGFRARYASLLGIQGVTGSGNDKPVTKPASAVVEFDLSDVSRRQTLYPRGRR